MRETVDRPQADSELPSTSRPGRRQPVGKIVVAIAVVLGVTAFFVYDLDRYVTLAALKANKDALQSFAEDHYVGTVAVFMIAYCLQTALSLPGAAIFTLAGGFLFGTVLGTLYVNVGATSGAVLAFLTARYLFREGVERRFGTRLDAIQRGFHQNAFNYLLTLRLIPLFPFFLVNLAAGVTRIGLATYVAATAIGIVPASIVYANAGSQLGRIESLKDIASPEVLGAFALLGALALVPVAYQRLRRRASPS